MMSYLVHSAYTVFFVSWLIVQVIKSIVRYFSRRTAESSPLLINDFGNDQLHVQNGGLHSNGTSSPDKADTYRSPIYYLRKHFIVSFFLAVLGFVTVYTWYLSLPWTIVSVNTAIYNCSCVGVFILSVIMLKERVSVLKLVALVLCTAGALVLMVPDLVDHKKDSDDESNVAGYVLVVASTGLYALYEVLYKKFAKMEGHSDLAAKAVDTDEILAKENYYYDGDDAVGETLSRESSPRGQVSMEIASDGPKQSEWMSQLKLLEETLLFLGMIGVYTLCLAWPGILVVHFAGWEEFELPRGKALEGILITMGLDSVFNILLMLAIFLSTPTFISVGSLLTIPASVLADYVFHRTVLAPLAYGGMGMIIGGFLGMSASEYIHYRQGHNPLHRPSRLVRYLL
jgi:drug/metabolite transporter (DMT)-like permease